VGEVSKNHAHQDACAPNDGLSAADLEVTNDSILIPHLRVAVAVARTPVRACALKSSHRDPNPPTNTNR
jgi:hypothetical protein